MTADLPALWLRPDLIASGYDDGVLRRRRRSGELATIRRGAYVEASDGLLDQDEIRHRLLVVSSRASLGREAVVSHVSAAALHGLPTWGLRLERAHFTRAQRTGGRVGRAVHLHTAPLPAGDVVEVDGMPVTSRARTVVDLARTVLLEAAVAVADAALRAGLSREELIAGASAVAGWPGAAAARQVASFADGRSESIGESRSRVLLRRYGFPDPVPQWEVRSGGRLVGRCDFAWPEARAVAEFDGRVKYGRLLRPGQDPGEVVFDEKLREDEIRAEGYSVARWIWRDLDDFARAASRIRRALAHR